MWLQATPDLAYDGVQLASPWVQVQLQERLSVYEADAAKRLVQFCTGLGAGLAAGAGGLHQGVAHDAFMRGGCFLLRNHRGEQTVIQLPTPRLFQFRNSQDIAETVKLWEALPAGSRQAGAYLLPIPSTFPAVDSAILLDSASHAAIILNSAARADPPASSISSGSFSSALSRITSTSTQLSATEPLEATDTDEGEGALTASAATLSAEASQAAAVMDETAATAASAAAGGKALVLGIQITTNGNHKINYSGWENFSSATGSRTLAFAVPPRHWFRYPPQKFDGQPADATQQAPCDQLVITWMPTTKAELNSLPVDDVRKLGQAFGIKEASTLPQARLVARLLKAAKAFTADSSVLEEALQQETEAGTEPELAASATGSVASATGLPVVEGQEPQGASAAQQFSKEQVMSWTAEELRGMCSRHKVPTKDANRKWERMAVLQARFISALGIDG